MSTLARRQVQRRAEEKERPRHSITTQAPDAGNLVRWVEALLSRDVPHVKSIQLVIH